jgi:serine/threonine protein kinase
MVRQSVRVHASTWLLTSLGRPPMQGVIQLSECYEDEHNVHLVTEFCAGGDLQKYVEVTISDE